MSPEALSPTPTTPAAVAAAPGRSRASWSGLLRLSLVAVPVQAYPAQVSAPAPSFHQLHRPCGRRIQHQLRCPVHGPVDAAEVVRGFPCAPGQHVVVEPDELDRLRPPQDRALVLEQLVAAHQVEPTHFAGRSLYLLPDGVAAQHPYGVLAQALRRADRWALGRVVLSGHRRLVLVRPAGPVLALDVLHYPGAVRPAAAWEADVRPAAGSAEELGLADTLIAAASGPLDWARYPDTGAAELAALVEAKLAGRPPAPPEEPAAVPHLLEALKRSVAAARAQAPPAPARAGRPRAPRRARA